MEELQKRVAKLEARHMTYEDLRIDFKRFVEFVATCRLENTDDWMEMLEEKLNEAAESLDEPVRFEFDGDIFHLREQL